MLDSSKENSVIYITGELSFETVPLWDKKSRSLISRNKNIVFDLSQITFSDNTGVALLIVLTSFAKKLQKEISFVNLPQQLSDLLSAVKVKDILPIK